VIKNCLKNPKKAEKFKTKPRVTCTKDWNKNQQTFNNFQLSVQENEKG
jgi:hypothetical protein